MMNREAPPLQPKKWHLYNQRIDAVVEDYDNYTDPLDYLKCVGELLYTYIFSMLLFCVKQIYCLTNYIYRFITDLLYRFNRYIVQ